MYKVYIENSAVLFAQQLPADPQGEVFRVAPGETPAITKFLQKLQFTKKLYVISENIERIFDEFRASLPFIEAAGGLVVDDAAKVLMIFRNGRWDLPKGKLETAPCGKSARSAVCESKNCNGKSRSRTRSTVTGFGSSGC